MVLGPRGQHHWTVVRTELRSGLRGHGHPGCGRLRADHRTGDGIEVLKGEPGRAGIGQQTHRLA
jgi:hypothetical protein